LRTFRPAENASAALRTFTLEQANAVARKYDRPDKLTFVLLSNASKIRGLAAKFGKVTERSVKESGWAGL
jgi:predicted Zn-dependent peptidase